jgi:hypothetical protein
MSSNKRSHPDHFVGLLCYKCKRTDFGGSARRLSSHVRYCNGPPQPLYYQKKKKKIIHPNDTFTTSHHNGMSQFPFNMAHRSIVGHTNEVCFSNFDNDFESGNPDDVYLEDNPINFMNSTDHQSAVVDDQIFPDHTAAPSNIHNPSIQPTHEASQPYNLDVGLPTCSEFQVELARICDSHRTDMKLFNEVNQLIKKHSIGRQLSFSSDNLSTRLVFIKNIGKSLKTERLQHTDVTVPLALGGSAITAVFDLEAQILSLLLDDSLMQPENFADQYDIFTGKATGPNLHYGEIHTGDSWEPARKHFCGDDYPNNMPIGLIVFGDESHFDSKGTLKTMPLMFTLSLFNQRARNDVRFWRPMAYIPNLGYGAATKEDSRLLHTKTPATYRLQNEHNCLAAALTPLVDISRRGGIRVTIKSKPVIVKVWIHFFMGDTSGHNRWLGHFNSGANIQRPYRDCKCSIDDMDNSDPTCIYLKRDDYHQHILMRSSLEAQRDRLDMDASLSKNPIINAFMNPEVPLSDLECGVYGMTPPERLHTTCEGVTKYIFESLLDTITKCSEGNSLIRQMELLHFTLHFEWVRNSERDYPRSAGRNGLMNGSKVTGSERRGNLLRLLCLSHTEAIKPKLTEKLREQSISITKFQKCLKQYLSMEEWFHGNNLKEEVLAARPMISDTIKLIQSVFPRDSGRGWKIPKLHGLTKFATYMQRFGSASNFFGGIGESNHKRFVKDTGHNTQQRASNFSSQVAQRYYERMVCDIANQALVEKHNVKYHAAERKCISYPVMEGKYSLTLNIRGNDFTNPVISTGKSISVKFVEAIVRFICHNDSTSKMFRITAFTCCKLKLEGREEIFRAISNYGNDGEWYDWCLISWDGYDEHYPARILGFFDDSESDTSVMAVVQSSPASSPMSMERMGKDFISKFHMPDNLDECTYAVPIESIVHPLCVFKNYGGPNREYFCTLPQRKWCRYFGELIT